MSKVEYRYYIAKGESLKMIEEFFAQRKAIARERVRFAKSFGADASFGTEHSFRGIAKYLPMTYKEAFKTDPAERFAPPPPGFRAVKPAHDERGGLKRPFVIWKPYGGSKDARAHRRAMGDKKFKIPSLWGLTNQMMGDVVFSPNENGTHSIHYVCPFRVGDADKGDWIIRVPVAPDPARKYREPSGAVRLKLSEYHLMVEKYNKKHKTKWAPV